MRLRTSEVLTLVALIKDDRGLRGWHGLKSALIRIIRGRSFCIYLPMTWTISLSDFVQGLGPVVVSLPVSSFQ